MPITVRFNFETNSSSQHSLSTRTISGWYTEEELARTEARVGGDVYQDAIIMMNESIPSTKDDLMEGIWAHDGVYKVWGHYLRFANSPMQVLHTFEQKALYAYSSIVHRKTKGWTKRKAEFDKALKNILPDVTFKFDEDDYYVSVAENILYPFLSQYKVSLEDFLSDKRYVVIVNYAEYCKMKWLEMVDEDNILVEYHPHDAKDIPIDIVAGIWHIHEYDLDFGRSPFRVLGTPEGKARYALASGYNVEDVIRILREVYPDLTEIRVERVYSSDEDGFGYSEGYAVPSRIPLREFILNKKYVVISDGDEYCIWDEFMASPLFKASAYETTDN